MGNVIALAQRSASIRTRVFNKGKALVTSHRQQQLDESQDIDFDSWILLDPEPELRIQPGREDLKLPRLLLDGAKDSPDLLTDPRLRRLVTDVLPARAEGLDLRLVFCTSRDGHSLRALYDKCSTGLEPATCCLLLVSDAANPAVYGAFLPCPLQPPGLGLYYGTPETCLFCFNSNPDSDTETFRAFFPTHGDHRNKPAGRMFVHSGRDLLMVGSGPALTLRQDLKTGSSCRCRVFNSPPLTTLDSARTIDEEFAIDCVQIWAFQVTR